MKMLPFFPPRLFEDDRSLILDTVRDIGMDPRQRFTGGEGAVQFTEEIRAELGARYAFACGSGSAALSLALHGVGIGAGDEVIVPAFGCQPVADTVVNLGAVPVFADVDPRTFVLDPGAVSAAITSRTAAVLPAHVFSVLAGMPALRTLAERHRLKIVEDAATALGASLDGIPAGRWGDAGVLSFSQFKPLGGIGEAGLALTDDPEVAHRCAESSGSTVGMDEILARTLLHRRGQLAARLDRKMEMAAAYTEAFRPLADKGLLELPPDAPPGRRFHVYAVLTDERDELRAYLRTQGVTTHVYYPVALSQQAAFAEFAGGKRFPRAEAVGRRNLALPIWPGLTDKDITYIAAAVLDYFTGR